MYIISGYQLFLFFLNLFSLTMFKVLPICLLYFLSQSLNLKLIFINLLVILFLNNYLSLEHIQFCCYALHLPSLTLNLLLQLRYFLCILQTRLPTHDLPHLQNLLLLLLDHYFLLHHLLSLIYQPPLQSLDLLFHFIDIWITLINDINSILYSIQFTTSMSIQGVLQFFTQSLNLQFLFYHVVLEIMDLILQGWYLTCLQ